VKQLRDSDRSKKLSSVIELDFKRVELLCTKV
jgi:hypothetical protein